MNKPKVHTLLSDVIVNGSSPSVTPIGAKTTFQCSGETSAGAGTATVTIQGSLDNTNWSTVDTLSLTLGTTTTMDHGSDVGPWPYMRATLSSLTGTDATVRAHLA